MFDLLILGAGPAGIAAAERAARMDARVCLVDARRAGGTDAVSGVVPARTLAHIAHVKRTAEQLNRYGIDVGTPRLDFERALQRCRDVVEEVHAGKERLAMALGEGRNLDIRENAGAARFVDPHTVALGDGTVLTAEKFVICIGGHPRRPDFPGGEHALAPSDLWRDSAQIPDSAVILGTGHTGIQVASILADFGCRVRILERGARILSHEDEDLALAIQSAFRQRGIDVTTRVSDVKRIARSGDLLTLLYSKDGRDRELACDAVIASLGWVPNTEGVGIRNAGVALDGGGFIEVSDNLQTSQPHIYAAGDVTGRMMLVTGAMQEGYVAAGNALTDANDSVRHTVVSTGGYPYPEHGSVGLTEASARKAYDCEVSLVRYDENTRAVIDGHTYGFCKLLVDRNSRLILGAHVVGERAVEIVQLVATGMATGLRVDQLAAVDLAYPTYAQIVGEAAYRACRALGIELRENDPPAVTRG
ncbi:MAG: NAD(P)/FAD-dependent oxidoreductase [Alphaproteobacteria bacterium]|nr:NAD(P)/FAD-dependent oxidoreductase [Alphaproteobacteria bacterium]